MSIKNVVVAGGGVLGSQIAFQTAYRGFNVTLWLRRLSQSKELSQRLSVCAVSILQSLKPQRLKRV